MLAPPVQRSRLVPNPDRVQTKPRGSAAHPASARSAETSDLIQRARAGTGAPAPGSASASEASLPESVTLALHSGAGRPLDQETRQQMGSRLGADLEEVRLHTGPASARAANDLHARAFTRGQDVHFGAGQFQPGTKAGDELLAHELVHTVQQSRGDARLRMSPAISQPSDPLEREAEAVATQAVDERAMPPGRLSISAGEDRIQRNGGSGLTNLQQLDEMLDRFDVPEGEVISLLGRMTAPEKAAVLAGGYRSRMASALNVGEMVRAVNQLNPPLATKLEWVEAAATFTSQIDYSDIKAMVIAAPQGERDALKTRYWQRFFVSVCTNTTMPEALRDLHFDLETALGWMQAEMVSVRAELGYSDIKGFVTAAPQPERDALKTSSWRAFFVQVCTNATMAEAVDDLAYDFITKLDWMISEGTDYTLVKAKIIAAPGGDKATALADTAFLGRLRDELGWNDFARSVELLGRSAPTGATLLADATVTAALAAAWTASNPAVPGPGTTQHEEGGWVYLNLLTGVLTTRRKSSGGQAAIYLGDPPTLDDSIVVAKFHTHPNLGPGWVAGPSGQDMTVDASHGVPDLVVSAVGNFVSGPAQRLHLAGDQGLPGATGGDAPQARSDGTFDEP